MPTFTRKLSDLMMEEFDFGLGEDDYPIFDEVRDADGNVTTKSKHREILNKKILKHYWNYEIGQETESMFRFSLNRKMNEIMPYYNQLYLSTTIDIGNPLTTVNYTDVVNSESLNTGTNETTSNTNSDTVGKSRSVSSTTPQVQLQGNEDYASSASDANSDTAVTATGTGNVSTSDSGSGTIDREVKGIQGASPASLLIQFRASFVNIDMQIIRDLETLFMQIWDNGDEFSASRMSGYYGIGYYWGI